MALKTHRPPDHTCPYITHYHVFFFLICRTETGEKQDQSMDYVMVLIPTETGTMSGVVSQHIVLISKL